MWKVFVIKGNPVLKRKVFEKRIYLKYIFVVLVNLFLLPTAVFAETGDINADGRVSAEDSLLLRDYLVGNAVGIYESNSDIDEDGDVDLKDLVLLERSLGKVPEDDKIPVDPIEPGEGKPTVSEIVYGQSEMGRDLVCTIIEPEHFDRTILVNFAIHGFEDVYDHDGQELVDTAELVIDHFRDAEDLHGCRLLIVSCANPDGLIDGTTNNGFGRCNANGVDLNRDFDAAHVVMNNARNYTQYPFSASESRALRDLVNEYHPAIVLDCHGWLDYTIGDSELAKVFYEEMGLSHHVSFSDNAHGYFSYWAHNQGALALLVEFTAPGFDRLPFLNAMERLVAGDYEDGNGIFEEDEEFREFSPTVSYTISTGHVTTYKDIEGESTGWIDGAADQCTIEKVYKNGWTRVRYPISSGYRSAYCSLDEFIDPAFRTVPEKISFKQNQTVYRRKDLSEKIGSVYSTDAAYCVADAGNVIQIVYPLDAGGWKMGWVSRDVVTFSDETQSSAASVMNSGRFLPLLSIGSGDKSTNTSSAEMTCLPIQTSPGETFELPVSVQAEDLIAARIWMMYDPDLLELAAVKNGTSLSGMSLNDDKDARLYCMLWSDSLQESPNSLEGTLALLTFHVKEDADFQDTSISFFSQKGDALGGSLDSVSLNAVSSTITVHEAESNVFRIPIETRTIEEEAFTGCFFDIAYLNNGRLVSIKSRAFAECVNLRKVYISESTTFISEDAFAGVEDLVIYAAKGSYAESFAKKQGITFEECEEQ